MKHEYENDAGSLRVVLMYPSELELDQDVAEEIGSIFSGHCFKLNQTSKAIGKRDRRRSFGGWGKPLSYPTSIMLDGGELVIHTYAYSKYNLNPPRVRPQLKLMVNEIAGRIQRALDPDTYDELEAAFYANHELPPVLEDDRSLAALGSEVDETTHEHVPDLFAEEEAIWPVRTDDLATGFFGSEPPERIEFFDTLELREMAGLTGHCCSL